MTVCVTYFTGLEATVRYEAETVEELVKLVAAFDEPDDNGWIDWHGGDCPVDFCTGVDVLFRNGNKHYGLKTVANNEWKHQWGDTDIVAYRVVK